MYTYTQVHKTKTHTQLGDFEGVEALLQKMLSAWRASPADGLLSTTGVCWCLEALAELQLKLGKVMRTDSCCRVLWAPFGLLGAPLKCGGSLELGPFELLRALLVYWC